MTSFFRRPAVSASALLALAASPALAEVTAQQVWDDWRAQMAVYGEAGITIGSETYENGVLTVTDLGFNVTGEDGSTATGTLPELVLTDIKMPPAHSDEGLKAAQEIGRRHPGTGVLVLSHYLESEYALRLLEDLPERSGYLLKDRVSDVAVLTDALRRIGQGECVIDPTIVSRLLARHHSGPLADLTAREREILALMAEGHSNEGICRLLFLSPKTVEGHIHQIFLKLDLGDLPAYNRRVLAVLRFLRPG